jgi:hypothetical protein
LSGGNLGRKASDKLRGKMMRRKAAALERLHSTPLGAGPGAIESVSCGLALVPVAPGGGCCGADRMALMAVGAAPCDSESARFVFGVDLAAVGQALDGGVSVLCCGVGASSGLGVGMFYTPVPQNFQRKYASSALRAEAEPWAPKVDVRSASDGLDRCITSLGSLSIVVAEPPGKGTAHNGSPQSLAAQWTEM